MINNIISPIFVSEDVFQDSTPMLSVIKSTKVKSQVDDFITTLNQKLELQSQTPIEDTIPGDIKYKTPILYSQNPLLSLEFSIEDDDSCIIEWNFESESHMFCFDPNPDNSFWYYKRRFSDIDELTFTLRTNDWLYAIVDFVVNQSLNMYNDYIFRVFSPRNPEQRFHYPSENSHSGTLSIQW
ncbi:MAG: hypothetical protein LBL87_00045 [Ruminococcus sp.]|nr:hypothetical protein [Ruminococcus sp.]